MLLSDSLSKRKVANTSVPRNLAIEGVINFRDLGGYQTANGRVVRAEKAYRSAHLSAVSQKGIDDLASLGIKTVIDLRFNDEIKRFPTMKLAFQSADIVSWQDCELKDSFDQNSKPSVGKGTWRESLDSFDPEQVREAMRINYPQKLYSHRAIYKHMLVCLSEQKSPLLFHCTAGKDRTGVAAALILALLGVPDNVIVQDYLISGEYAQEFVESFYAAGAVNAQEQQDFHASLAQYPSEVIAPVFEANERYITTLLDYVNEHYGNFTNYAQQQLGFDKQSIQQLKSAMLI